MMRLLGAVRTTAATLLPVAASTIAIAAPLLLVRRLRSRATPSLRLTYLDIKGYAEPIRLALTVGDIPFEDVRTDYAGVHALRESGRLPFGQVPLLEIDGVPHCQSLALLRYAGIASGLYPPELQLRVDGVEETLQDIRKAFTPMWYKNAAGRHPKTGDFFSATALNAAQVAALQAALNDDILPGRFAMLERVLSESGGPFFCGEQMTTCDLSYYVMGSGLVDGSYCEGIDATALLRECPKLRGLVDAVRAHPRVAEWNERVNGEKL